MWLFIQIASWGDSYGTHNICFFYGKVKKSICYYQIHILSVALQLKQTLNGHISSQVLAPHKVEKYICWLKMKHLFSYIHPEKKNKKKTYYIQEHKMNTHIAFTLL